MGVENYGRIDPASGLHTRFVDFVRCLEFVVDLALEKGVDMVLFAGDIYKSPTPNPTWQREFAVQLHRLQEERVSTVIVVGNHDTPSSYGRATSVDVFNALALVDTYDHFAGHGYFFDDEDGPAYDADDPTGWLADCESPNNRGHHELRRLFFATM